MQRKPPRFHTPTCSTERAYYDDKTVICLSCGQVWRRDVGLPWRPVNTFKGFAHTHGVALVHESTGEVSIQGALF